MFTGDFWIAHVHEHKRFARCVHVFVCGCENERESERMELRSTMYMIYDTVGIGY